jgi:hypothetical protein
MTWQELDIILRYYGYRYRDAWEQARAQLFTLVNINSKKRVRAEDLLPFAWDSEKKEPMKINKARQKAVEETAKMFEIILSNGK